MAVIAIDWDNTLVDGSGHWLDGAKEAITTLRGNGHKVVIHSCNRAKWIQEILLNAGVPVDHIWEEKGKPLADLYLDDKGYHFPYNGNWNEEIGKVLERVKELDNRKW